MARVLLVDFDVVPAPDRRSVQLLNLMKALAPRYEVDVLTVKSPDLAYVDRFMRTRMLRVPVGDGKLGEQVEAFRRAVRRQLEGDDYDVIHFRSAWAGLPVCEAKAAAGAGARLVFEPALSPLSEPPAADPELGRRLAEDEETCLGAADRIVVPTAVARAHLEGRGMGARTDHVPSGVDVDHFDWEPVEVGERPRVVYAGVIAAGRGVRLLLQAMALVRARRNAELVLVGPVEDSFRPALDEAIRAAGLEAQVTQTGALDHDEMPRVLSGATVCAAPSAPDAAVRPLAPLPMKVLEYLACRRAVVAARRPVVEEALTDGQEALLFAPGSHEALAEALLRVLEDDALRLALAEAGYRKVRQAYPASAVRRRFLEIYAALAPPAAVGGRLAHTLAPGLPTAPETTTARRENPAGPARPEATKPE